MIKSVISSIILCFMFLFLSQVVYSISSPYVKKISINECNLNLLEDKSITFDYQHNCIENLNKEEPIEEIIEEPKEKNLMIVAHPDDETIWGGGHLLADDYYVVCVTCGNVKRRNEEFMTVMEKTNDEYIFLGYPDVVNGYINDWSTSYDSIVESLRGIINSRNWNTIVTHNPDGEYGHFHHKTLNTIVTELADKDKLYYFGRYYQKNEVPEMPSLDESLYNTKMTELISVYKSQPIAMSRHRHMMPYENFVAYNEW